ncbi:MAG: hypothetical protein HY924_10565 [Elusimicrobia bacterium]|nr:hypothetical protein [Elusimicrobiota bacterium]
MRGFFVLSCLFSLAAAPARGAAFSLPEFQAAKTLAMAQASLSREGFLTLRDRDCREPTESCILAMARSADRFQALAETEAGLEPMIAALADPAAVKDWTAAEKRALRRELSELLSGIVIWVHGLDELLNARHPDPAVQAALDAAQTRLQHSVDLFAAGQFSLSRRAAAAMPNLPFAEPRLPEHESDS